MIVSSLLRRLPCRGLFLVALAALPAPHASAQAYLNLDTRFGTVWDTTTANWRGPSGALQTFTGEPRVDITGDLAGFVDITTSYDGFVSSLALRQGANLTANPALPLVRLFVPTIDCQATPQNTPTITLTALQGDIRASNDLSITGDVILNTALLARILTFNDGKFTLGATSTLTATNFLFGNAGGTSSFTAAPGSTLSVQNSMELGISDGLLTSSTLTGATVNVGNLILGQRGGTAHLIMQSGVLNIEGTFDLQPSPRANGQIGASVVVLGSTVTVADTAGKPGMNGAFFKAGVDAQNGAFFALPNATVKVRPGGFLTIAIDRTLVNNTTFDTTGGNMAITGRFDPGNGPLIKVGPGILALSRANEYGPTTSAFDIRGGLIEFNSTTNFGPAPNTAQNIILNGGGLRWTAGNTFDISPRLQSLNAAVFDTNGNDVTFATALSGTGGMKKVGGGTLTLSVPNSWGGDTTILGGAIAFPSLSSFGSGRITLNGGGVRWLGNAANLSPRLNPLGSDGGTFDTNGNNVTFTTGVRGTGSLTKLGAGTLQLTGLNDYSGATVVEAGALRLRSGTMPALTALSVGRSGTASMTIGGPGSSNAQVSATTTARVAENAGSTGTLTLEGPTASLTLGSYLEVGSGGNGTLNLLGGGRVTTASTAALGVLPGSLGTVSVTGSSGGVGSMLQVGSTLFVGYLSTALLNVGSGGTVSAGNLSLGLLAGSSGSFTLSPGGLLNVGGTDGITGGTGTNGTGSSAFVLGGGTLRVVGSALTTSMPFTLSNQSVIDTFGFGATLSGALGGSGGFIKTGGGTLTLGGANTYSGGTQVFGGNVSVPSEGGLGSGPLTIFGGSVQSTGNLALDRTVTVDGPGAVLTASGFLQFGGSAPGSLVVRNGGTVSGGGTFALGVLNGANGVATLAGSGSSLTISSTLFLGYLGQGTVVVGAGSTLSAGNVSLGDQAGGSGSFTIAGTLQLGGANGLAIGGGSGAVALSGGTIRVVGSTLTSAVPITLSGDSLIDTNGFDATLSGVLSGPGPVRKTGAGTLILSAANTMAGGVTCFVGTVRAIAPASLGSGPVVLGGGTLDLPFSGTATVFSLNFDGILQVGGTWGSLTSTATNKTSRITGPGLLEVLTDAQPVTFNPATTAGLGTLLGNGPVDLATATGATPPGGTFSGPGVTGGSFDPAVVGYGVYTLTYTANTRSNTFTISVTGGLTLDEEGGSFAPGNLAPAGTAFAKNVLPGFAFHTIAHLNDGVYGNPNSWIGVSVPSFAGINLGASPVAVNRLAFGRDNAGLYTDRVLDHYTIQYTTDPNPNEFTTAWTSIGAVDYNVGTSGVTTPARRHVYSFPPVNATGLRIITASFGTAIDEIELYGPTGVFPTGQLVLLQEGGTFAPANLAAAGIGATAFAKDVAAGSSAARLNDGVYGDANSWVGLTNPSFGGLDLAAANAGAPVLIDRIALGRDNVPGGLADRTFGRYTVQYTTAANPNAATPDANWTTIGFLDYQTAGGANFAAPARRHLFGFPPVTATGVRVLTSSTGNALALDEIEIYRGAAALQVENPAGTPVASGTGAVEFGTVYAGGSVVRTFALTNLGTSSLQIATLAIEGANATEFGATLPGSFLLPPGAGTTFVVVFTPATEGVRTATLRIGTDDPVTPSYTCALSGTRIPPGFNPAATAGLSVPLGTAAFDLLTVSGAAPGGGTFSGPGVTGGTFDPAAVGYGVYPIAYTAGGVTSTFTIGVTGGLTLDEEGGSFVPGNLAPAGTPFAKDVFPDPKHFIAHLNDATYGNSNSWIGFSQNSFAGVSLGATPVSVSRIAFGRDSQGAYTDRCLDFYTIQYTTAPNPDANTTQWTTIGAVDYRAGGGSGVAQPHLRHVFSFPPVNATGLRIVVLNADIARNPFLGTCIDEIELYPATGLFTTGGITLLQQGGAIAPNDLAYVALGGFPFAKDAFANFSATYLNDGGFGLAGYWISFSANSFAGVNLNGTFVVDRIAFGRDNTRIFGDRCLGRYTLQYTTAPSPSAATPDEQWTTIGLLDYQSAGGANFSAPAQRHLYAFPAVTATGLRLITEVQGTAIDEIEIYRGQPSIGISQSGLPLVSGAGSVDFGNLAVGAPVSRLFTVTNSGSASLLLNAGTVTGAAASDFAPAVPADSVLAPGAGTTFSVQFAPLASGARAGTLQLASNDPLLPSFAVALTGNGLTPLGAWRQQFFGNFLNTGNGADDADPNRNGIANLVEYALHGDAVGPAAGIAILPTLTRAGGRLQLNLTRYFDRPDVTLTVQGIDLLTGTWTDLAQSVSGTPFVALTPGVTVDETFGATTSAVAVQDAFLLSDPAHPKRFLRLRVTSP